MKIAEIYEKYKIPPWLQTHMYRVASVSATLFDARGLMEGRDALISACLLHDMGNIIKFDFSLFPELYTADEKQYWQEVQKEYKEKYGDSTHTATEAIAKEVGLSVRAFEILLSIGFGNAVENEKSNDILKKIATYADMRVMPDGVAPLSKRLADLRVRYKNNPKRIYDKEVERQERALYAIECELFNGVNLVSADIREESISAMLEKVQCFDIVPRER
jgi:hypothetical protein